MGQAIEVFEFVINVFVALTGMVFCAALVTRENRQRIHILTAVFTGLVSFGTLARTFFWLTNAPIWLWLTYFFYAVFPLGGLLFFEGLSDQRPPTSVKIIFLTLPIVLVTWLIFSPSVALATNLGFLITLAGSHTLLVLAGLVLLWRGARAPETPARLRSILWGVWIFLLVTVPLLSVDWLNSFGFRTPRLGPVAILTLIHVLFRVFNARGDFSIRTETVNFGSTIFGLLLFASILWTIENSKEADHVLVIAFLALLCQIPVNFMRHYWLRIRSVGQPSTLERLNRLRGSAGPLQKTTIASFAKSLIGLDEINKITWISPKRASELELGRRIELSQPPITYISLSQLEADLRSQGENSKARLQSEFLRHLLLTTGGTSLLKIDDERGYLSIQFSAFMQESYYRELGVLLATMASLQPIPASTLQSGEAV